MVIINLSPRYSRCDIVVRRTIWTIDVPIGVWFRSGFFFPVGLVVPLHSDYGIYIGCHSCSRVFLSVLLIDA